MTRSSKEPDLAQLGGSSPPPDLERKAARGGFITLASQGGRVLLQVVTTAALARLLTPRDFGLFGMVIVLVGLIQLVNDLGLNAATIQRAELSERQVSAMFWVNLAASTAFAALTALSAPLLAAFYREPELRGIVMALAITLVLAGASGQHYALISRQLRFGVLSTIDLSAMLAGTLAAVISAWRGAGVWALVYQQLASATTRAAMLLAFSGWVPGRPAFGVEERSMLRFGGHVTGFRIVNFFSRNLDNALLGWYWDAHTLGIYSRAYALFMAPMSNLIPAVRRVMETSMSRVQSDVPRFTALYKRAEETVAWLIMPLAVLIAVAATPAVRVLLGPNWDAVVPILRLLSIASLVQPILNSTGWLFTATGRGDALFKWGLISSLAHCVAFAGAVSFGNLAMAGAAAGVRVLLAPIGLRMGMAVLPLTLKDLCWELRWPVLVTLCGGALAALALRLSAGAPALLQLIAASVGMYACVAVGLALTGRFVMMKKMLARERG